MTRARYCRQCLRPRFTDQMVTALRKGEAINLIATTDQGSQRLLDDIMLNTWDNTLVLYADMASHRENYSHLVRALWQQLDAAVCGDEPPLDFNGVIQRATATGKNLLLLLHRFDALLSSRDIDSRYDNDFFDSLEHLRERPDAALVCVTTYPHNRYVVLLEKNPQGRPRLQLRPEYLPPLDRQAVRSELRRRLPELDGADLKQVAGVVCKHRRPYVLLEVFANKLEQGEDAELDLSQRLVQWQRQVADLSGALSDGLAPSPGQRLREWLRDRLGLASLGRLFGPSQP